MAEKIGKIELTEDNAADLARKEMKLESEGKNPDLAYIPDPEEEKLKQLKEQEETPEGEEKREEETQEKSDEDILSAEEATLTAEEKARKKELIESEEAETKRLIEAKEEELSEEDKEKRQTVLLKKETREKEAFEIKVSDYAKTKSISTDDARKTLESIAKITSKYENNPERIAESNLGLQRLVSAKDEELKAVKEQLNQPRRPQTAGEWEQAIRDQGLVGQGGQHQTWEMVVAAYRAKNPDVSELEDEQVLKLVAKEIHIKAETYFEKQKVALRTEADKKREQLLSTLSEQDKEYTDDIKRLLATVPDNLITAREYDLEPALRWARGGKYTPDYIAELERQAEERGFKRGQASKKIISGPVGKGGAAKGKTVVSLSPKQKEEAQTMFPDTKTEQEAYELYADVMASRKNKEKK